MGQWFTSTWLSLTTEQNNRKHGLTYAIILVQEPVENANEANSEAEEDSESSRPKTNKKLGIDYFNNQETDLKKTGAMSKYLSLLCFYVFSTPLAHNFTPL